MVGVGEGSGWVRVYGGEDGGRGGEGGGGSLVYLTLATQVRDVCRDLVLGEHLTIWMQWWGGGAEGRRLGAGEAPLALQDGRLRSLGYDDASRRARLGIDPDLEHILRFYIGPAGGECGGRGGSVLVLKGLVLPQWRRRQVDVIGDKLFIHPGCGGAGDVEVVSLGGAEVEVSKSTRCGRKVLRVAAGRQLFLGFDTAWERRLWWSWITQASESESGGVGGGAGERLDLSGSGLERLPAAVITTWPDLRQLTLSRNRLQADGLQLLDGLPRLRRLAVASNAWPAVPPAITRLVHLTHLDLSDNRIATLPHDFARLHKLEELRVDRNELSAVPGDGDCFPALRHFSAAHNHLTALPGFLHRTVKHHAHADAADGDEGGGGGGGGAELRSVHLRANALKGNIILGNYGNLTQLDVSENSIESLDLSALDRLENVQCSRNRLLELTLNGASLLSLIAGNNKLQKLNINPRPTQLKHLDISYNELTSLPEWIGGCRHLRTLFASHNRLAALPDHLFCNGELASLQTLQLSFNRLASLPSVIRHLPVQELFLQSNCIATLPDHFFVASSRLRVLNLSNNCLQCLPRTVCDDHPLETLYLSANLLTDLVPLARMHALRTLHAAYNNLLDLPDSCTSSWSELEELVLSGNQLTRLPDNITRLTHLRVLRVHSNMLRTCPSLGTVPALRVLDMAHNRLDRINLASLVSQRLQFLDVSGNPRLHVDAKQFQAYRTQRAMSLVDVSGQNRSCLPSSPSHHDTHSADQDSLPWTLGFSETSGSRDRLCISQLRQPAFCNSEALVGLFDSGNNAELPQRLVKAVPRILLEERTVKETASEYMKYTMLSAHRELKEGGQRCGMCAVLCHVSRQKTSQRRFVMRIASVGEARALLCRTTGSITIAHSSSQQPLRNQLGSSQLFQMVVPDPHITELVLSDHDEFLIIANKSLWEVVGEQEAVSVARPVCDAVLAAKRLQDTAQSYGCEDNLSVLVLRFHPTAHPGGDNDPFVRELRSTLRRAVQVEVVSEGEEGEGEGDRSSPSGQSDQASSVRGRSVDTVQTRHYVADKNDLIMPHPYQSVLMHENGTRKMTPKHKALDLYTSGNLADGEETSSDRSTQLSEEQFRCWEYMLEQNTQLLFDKELDTLSRGCVRRSVPTRPSLWPRARSNPALNEPLHAQQQPPFLSRHFGSARSFHPIPARPMLGGSTRSLHGGPNAAYFGSLQRLMPYHLEYDFSVIRERSEPSSDSLEQDGGRMHKYWDVATTEL